MAYTDVYNANMEVVNPTIPALFELVHKDTAYSLLTKASSKHKITRTPNAADFRIGVKVSPAGVYGKVDLDGGALATGTGPVVKQMVQTYFPTQFAVKLTTEEIESTADKSLSVMNVLKDTMKEALPGFQHKGDVSLHNMTSGSQGLIALGTNYAAATATTGTFTFDTEHAANLLQVGMRFELFDVTLAAHKTTGLAVGSLPYITSIDKTNGTAACAGMPIDGNAPASTDYLALPGCGATPAWMNGLYYFHNSATSGNLLGLARGTYQELISNSVNAAGSLVPLHGTLLKARIRQRTGSLPSNLKGLIHDAQASQIVALTIAISQFNRKKADEVIDPVPSYGEYIPFCGVEHLIDIRQSKKRIDWINPEFWLRVYGKEPGFYQDPQNGNMLHPCYDSSGNKVTAMQFWLYAKENFAMNKPAADGFIYGLTIPTDF